MKIGIGLPATIPGTDAGTVMDWARRADAGSFSSLGIIDRLVYPNYEPMITLAAAAAVTQRVRLMTTVLVTPIRNPGVLAKQAATLDAISGGRLTLGLGLGAREDDYQASPAEWKTRGKRFDAQLATMKGIWSGGEAADGVGSVGPAPAQQGGPELLIGGSSPAALQRVGRWADGVILPGTPESVGAANEIAQAAWKEAGRSGNLRLVGAAYFALGTDPQGQGADYVRDYYAFAGDFAEMMVQGIIRTPEAIKGAIEAFAAIGMDELIMWPTISNVSQMDQLAEIVG